MSVTYHLKMVNLFNSPAPERCASNLNLVFKLTVQPNSLGTRSDITPSKGHRTVLISSQHWTSWRLRVVRHQAITWASFKQALCWHMASLGDSGLIHWDRVTHICVSKLTSIVSDNGLSPGRRRAIIWTNAGILFIGPLGTNSSEIIIGNRPFWFKKMRLKMSSGKWRPFCPGLNVLTRSHTGGTNGAMPFITCRGFVTKHIANNSSLEYNIQRGGRHILHPG